MPSADANGVEPLEGETEEQYVARQTRLREEAAARMRAKFGGSGGLGGGMHMGGIGSQPQGGSSGGLLSGGLSKLGSVAGAGLSIAGALASVGAEVAKSAVETAREKVAARTSGGGEAAFSASDLVHLRRDGGGVQEGSRDLSDLLGSVDVSDSAPPPHVHGTASSPARSLSSSKQAFGSSNDVTSKSFGDDFWGDDWGQPPPGVAKPKPAVAPNPLPPTNTPLGGSVALTPASPAPASMHFGGVTSATKPKKVAAVKTKGGDAGWDDWGDDKW